MPCLVNMWPNHFTVSWPNFKFLFPEANLKNLAGRQVLVVLLPLSVEKDVILYGQDSVEPCRDLSHLHMALAAGVPITRQTLIFHLLSGI